jgi:hypothetical protein
MWGEGGGTLATVLWSPWHVTFEMSSDLDILFQTASIYEIECFVLPWSTLSYSTEAGFLVFIGVFTCPPSYAKNTSITVHLQQLGPQMSETHKLFNSSALSDLHC